MARNEIFIDVPPRAVFELLSDPRSYSHWVVGSYEVRAGDEHWPQEEAAFDHSVGRPPLVVKDNTTVRAVLPPVMVELRASGGPMGTARVALHLTPEGTGTRVTMIEEPASRLGAVLIGLLGHATLKARNAETLRRLKRLAEGEEERPAGELPRRGGRGGSGAGR